MKKLRPAVVSDKNDFRKLWDISFGDSKTFSDWFFDTRFVPDYCALIEEENGDISSEVQSMPIFLNVRGVAIPSTIMVGACTHPDYKRRGYMKELYTYYMNMIGDMGVVLCAHTPAVLRTYFYVGHYPVSDTAFIETESSQGASVSEDIAEFDLKTNISSLLKCYSLASQKYSGIVLRSFADFKLKISDYLSCNAKCACVINDNNVTAYAVYFDDENGISGEEIISLDELSEQKIVNFLFNVGKGRKVKVKLPPKTKSEYNGGIKTVKPRNVCGVANAPALLKAVGQNLDYVIEIKDAAVEKNNGVFNFSGERTDKQPDISMEIQYFAQWIMGYRALDDIIKNGEAKVLNPKSADELNKLFPKLNCHIVDEY